MLRFLSFMLCASKNTPIFTLELLGNFTYHWELDDSLGLLV